MKTRLFSLLSIILALVLLGPGEAQSVISQLTTSSSVLASHPAYAAEAMNSSPIMFVENIGQFNDEVRFKVVDGNAIIWLTDDAVWVSILEPSLHDTEPDSFDQGGKIATPGEDVQKGVNVKLSFPNANPAPYIEPFNRLDTKVSYFTSNDPEKWRSNMPTWGGVRYINLYPGIDLEVFSINGHWDWKFVQNKNQLQTQNTQNISLLVEGADRVALDNNSLQLTTMVGNSVFPLPKSDLPIEVKAVNGNEQLTIHPLLVVSPETEDKIPQQSTNLNNAANDLIYSTFLGGSGTELVFGLVVDDAGNAYIAGKTSSSDFPTTPGAFDTSFSQGFITKLNADGSDLIYSTFLGGGGPTSIQAIALDGTGNAYVTGYTQSSDFPVTTTAFDTSVNGIQDAFVTKLNADGTDLVFSTFLGGEALGDVGTGIEVDNEGSVYVTGHTESQDFPTTSGAFQETFGGGRKDAFVTKLDPSGSNLIYSTYLGGNDPVSQGRNDRGLGIAIDATGNAYITGSTNAPDFPTTQDPIGPIQGDDVFITKLNAAGSSLAYSIIFGGSFEDSGHAIDIDDEGNAYVTGGTWSFDFPTTSGVFQETRGGNYDVPFVVKLNASGTGFAYSTYLGGASIQAREYGTDIIVDASGHAHISGLTQDPAFPTTTGVTFQNFIDPFVAKLNPSGSDLVYATLVGWSDFSDFTYHIALDDGGNVYIAGPTNAPDFPTTPGAYDETHNGQPLGSTLHADAFVAKLAVADTICISTETDLDICQLQFDGVDDFVSIPDNNGDFDFGTTFTVEAWVKPLSLSSNGLFTSILGGHFTEPPFTGGGWQLVLDRNDYSNWGLSVCVPDCNIAASGPGGLETNQWQHLAGTYDGNTIRIYKNGNFIASTPHSGNVTDINFVLVGIWETSFNGVIDEVRIWNIARTQSDIQATMNHSLTGNEPGLVGYWRFDEGSGQIVFDSTSRNNDGRLGSSPTSDSNDPVWIVSDAPVVEPGREPVILLPGFPGSEMWVARTFDLSVPNGHGGTFESRYSEGEKVWVNIFKVLIPGDDDYFDVLKLQNDGHTPVTPENDDLITPGFVTSPPDDGYSDLLTFFQEHDYTLGKDLFLFPYDFRKDLSSSIAKMEFIIRDALISVNDDEEDESRWTIRQVNLVSHSTGGTLVREYIRDPQRSERVHRAIAIAPGYLGTPKIYQAALFGTGLISHDLLNPNEIRDLLRNWPGAFEMAPSRQYWEFYDGSPGRLRPFQEDRDFDGDNQALGQLNYDQTKTLLFNLDRDDDYDGDINRDVFNLAEDFHNSLDRSWDDGIPVPEVHILVGSGYCTIGQIHTFSNHTRRGTKLGTKVERVNGDETIPLFSASLYDPDRGLDLRGPGQNKAKVYYAKLNHQAIKNDGTGLSLVMNILEGDPTLPTGWTDNSFDIPRCNGEIISVGSPVELHVFDSAGNHTGPSGIEFVADEEIPNSTYDEVLDAKFIYLPEGGVYTIHLVASDAGEFDLRLQTYADDVVVRTILYLNIPLTPTTVGEVIYDTTTPDPPILRLDHDGNGVFDEDIPPASVLNEDESADIEPPVISIHSPMEDHILAGKIPISWSVTDDVSGVLSELAVIDAETPSAQTVENNSVLVLSPGEHTLKVVAGDRAGNGSQQEIGFLVYLFDIKPGSDPNSINCNNANEVIAVAILTTDDFDATTVDHTTITFEGASETHVDKKTGEARRHEEDVDGDGDTDLVFHFRMGDTGLTCDSTDGTLTGETFDGQTIQGTDTIRMINQGEDQP